jgi:TATA-binding protein-associated factor Taf7
MVELTRLMRLRNLIAVMARGWESKAIADQIEEEESRQPQAANAEITPEQRILKERLDSLKLSRSRLLQQLERATHPAHRNVLLNGLKAVEKEIEEAALLK